ncbi:MAG: peptidase M20, partial [Anaerolineae bacterium]|nr:peptidase M20 [Anaerolineae bacterium]
MTDNRENALAYAHKNKDNFLHELKEVLRIPSISTNSENKADMLRTAEWLTEKLRGLGME